MVTKFRYISDGAFLPGIPARDLSDADLAQLTPEQRTDIEANAAQPEGTRIYEKADAKAKAASEGE